MFDHECDNSSIPQVLEMEQLIRLGKDCGFDEKDEGELSDAANQLVNGA
jgi:hypothetical protein